MCMQNYNLNASFWTDQYQPEIITALYFGICQQLTVCTDLVVKGILGFCEMQTIFCSTYSSISFPTERASCSANSLNIVITASWQMKTFILTHVPANDQQVIWILHTLRSLMQFPATNYLLWFKFVAVF